MIGYIIAGVLGLVLLGFVVAGMAQSKPGTSNSGRLPGKKPVQSEAPAAEEPTPDNSVTADEETIRRAREHTPLA